MSKYKIEMFFEYEVETDDLNQTMDSLEFPVFIYPDNEDKIKFIYNMNKTSEIGQ